MGKRFGRIRRFIMIASMGIVCLGLVACAGEEVSAIDGERTEQAQDKVEEAQNDQKGSKSELEIDEMDDMEPDMLEEQKRSGKDDENIKDQKNPSDASKEEDNRVVKNGSFVLAHPSQNGALSVKGTQLVDEKEQAVQLRGVSTHGIAWFPDFVNQDAVIQLSNDWGANLFRIAMYTDENGGYCTDGDKEKLKKLVADGVGYAKQADMYVIVDWHVLHDQNPLTHKDEAIRFFDEMSGKFKDENHVIYEICNEPNGDTTWEDVKAYAEEVIPVIRNNAKDAVILVGTPTWSQEIDKPQKDPITGYNNIMYTLHFYAATHKEDLRNKMKDAIAAGTPVFVSEYGLCDASGNGGNDLAQAGIWVDTMDQLGVSYAVWSFCNKNETSALIASNCQKTSSFAEEDLSESGKWIYALLHEEEKDQEKKTETSTICDASADNSADVHNLVYGDFAVDAQVIGSWESEGKNFYQYQLTVTNEGTEAVTSWEISVMFSKNIMLSDGWNGEYTVDGRKLTIRSKDYNGKIEVGGTVADVGFIVSASGELFMQ